MVTFKPSGRCGNFLFTAACMISYAKKHNLEFSMPSKTNDTFWNPVYLQHLVNPKFDPNKETITIKEKTLFKFEELPFEESWRDKNIILEGYFQNPKYFEQDRKTILDLFNIPWMGTVNTVAIFVRRGDYLTLTEKHPPVSTDWINDAMNQFPDSTFYFFSDDIPWCKKTFGHRPDCKFSEGTSEMVDLQLASCCENQINSASTFSWWGAWLNQNPDKKVIVPKPWLTPSHSNEWTEEIVPKNWIRL